MTKKEAAIDRTVSHVIHFPIEHTLAAAGEQTAFPVKLLFDVLRKEH